MSRRQKGAVLELAILGVLKEQELHGYELKKRLTEVLGAFSSVSFGSLYPALARLEAAGAVRIVVEAPEPELPAPSARPRRIVNVADVEPVTFQRDRVDARSRFLGRALGARRTALNLAELSPGSEAAPPHCHSAIEELFVVLEGDGVLMLGGDEGEEHPVRAGSLVSRPPATGVAHQFVAGDGTLSILCYSDIVPSDLSYYPDSNKVGLRYLDVVVRVEPVDYWDGEA
jgi:uncharacterized cupin superfamily protein